MEFARNSFLWTPRIRLIALLLTFCFSATGQITDTIFLKDKVILKNNILSVLTYPEFEQLKRRKPLPDTNEINKTKIFELNSSRAIKIVPLNQNRPTNSCGVTASFTPSGDTTLNVGIHRFTNTSRNATSYWWLVNGLYYTTDTDLYNTFDVGIYELALVATNGTCSDTMKSLISIYGTAPSDPNRLKIQYGLPGIQEDASTLVACPGGGYLLAGTTLNVPRWGPNAMLIRIKEQGCIEWSRILDEFRIDKVHRIIVTRDSGFLVAASGPTPSFPFGAMLIRMDKFGNTIWTKSYAEGMIPYGAKGIVEADDGSIVVAAETSSFYGFSVFKINGQGNLLWNRAFARNTGDWTLPNNITIKGNAVYVTGYIGLPNANSEYNYDGLLIKLDLSNGNEIWTKTYDAGNGSNFFQDIHVMGDQLLVNNLTGHYLGGADIRQLLHYIDEDGNLRRSYIIRLVNHVFDNPVFSNLVPLSNGKFYIFQKGTQPLPLQPYYSNKNFFIKTDTNQNIYWQRGYWYSNYARLYAAVKAPNEGIAAIGMEPGELFRKYLSYSENIAFFRSDSAGQAFDPFCYGENPNHAIDPITATSSPYQWPVTGSRNMRDTVITLNPYQPNTELRYGCPDYISKCSFLDITGPDKPCDLNQTYTFRTKKDPSCGEPIAWVFDPTMRVISQSDTAVQIQFTTFGNYFIKVRLPYSCTPFSDSIKISVAPRLELLNLGRDTSICAEDSFQLHAGKDFINYRWQDGSADSTFLVRQPGLYYVEVTDSCGNSKTDSILVSLARPFAINIGPDHTICSGEKVTLVAPTGYRDYIWYPTYYLDDIDFYSIQVSPRVDTFYTLQVVDWKGCVGLDTIRFTVNHSIPINLGNDTSFCAGGSILLNAGPGFQSYKWNNGNSNQQFTATAKGIYSVIATAANNCKSYDTLEIRNVFLNPIVNLPQDPTLCIGDNRILDAGSGYSQYNWSDGSSGSRITVSTLGTFWVNVVDANNCAGGDTTTITQLLPPPANFLPADTSLCSYGKLTLIPAGNFKTYAWSNGSVTNGITIDKAGTYSLTVTDINGCKGTDAVIVTKKDCLQGFYVPNAFTPNNDRTNPTFRPLLFGNVKQYRFTIYNRYGQRVFETTELLKGWDGTINGLQQASGTFVWTCTYQFENEAVKTEKGTVILIR